MRVLVISGKPETISDYLKEAGHEVRECLSTDLAERMAEKHGPDAALFFGDVPEVSSVSHREALKTLIPNMRVILLVERQDPLVLYAAALGIRDFVFLPSAPSRILHRLENPARPEEAAEMMDGTDVGGRDQDGTPVDRLSDAQRQRKAAKQRHETVLLAAGEESEALRKEMDRNDLAVAGVCRYREQLLALTKKAGASVVVLSPALPGAVSITDLVSALRGTRIVLLPGERTDPNAQEIARNAVKMGVRDIAWDAASAVGMILVPSRKANMGNLPSPVQKNAEKRAEKGGLFAFFKRPKHKSRPLPAEVEPVRLLSQPTVRAAAIGFDTDFPTVRPEDAEVIFVTPERLTDIYGRSFSDAKIYLVGEGAVVWRQALKTGLTPVLPEKIPEFLSMSHSISVVRKCLIVYSSKTSVGKTSLSLTGSVLLANEGRRVCLVDADDDGRTSARLLLGDKIAPGGSIYQTRYGVDVVCMPEGTDSAYNRLAAHALQTYDAIVVDCPGRLKMPRVVEAFLGSSLVLLVSSCNSASVAAVRGFIEGKMREYDISDRTVLVCNRSEKAPPLQPADVQREIGFKPFEDLPYDELVDKMFASRTPLPAIRSRKSRRFEQAVREILKKYLPEVCC